MRLEDDWPDVFVDLAGLIQNAAAPYLSPEQTEPLTRDFIAGVSQQFAGCLLYIPKADDWRRRQRNAAICRDYNGHNIHALARRYGLSVASIYSILARERTLRQNSLFD